LRFLGIPEQVVRLSILFVAAIVILLLVRQRFVPESFGETGHYRADAVDAIVDQNVRYAGLPACAECHEDEAEVKSRSYHRGLTCEGCHGPAQTHVDDPGEHLPVVPRGRDTCLRCHEYLVSRPTGFPQIVEAIHNPMVPCTDCHNPHDPTPPEVPGACSACHAAIDRIKAVSHHWSLDCETCHETAPEHKENPRAFPPKKPTRREFCGGCHAEDADSPREIPRIDLAAHGGRYLCWQCHYPHFPEGI
jgi:cytochrome c553